MGWNAARARQNGMTGAFGRCRAACAGMGFPEGAPIAPR